MAATHTGLKFLASTSLGQRQHELPCRGVLSNYMTDTGGHLKRDAIDDVQGVNDIAQRLRHLAAMGITDHGVQIHLLEGHLACTTYRKQSEFLYLALKTISNASKSCLTR